MTANVEDEGQDHGPEPPQPSDWPPPPVDSYTDEQGRTITVYPPRFKPGTFMQGYTVRPRRG